MKVATRRGRPIIQSSGATTVMVVSFVNAEILTLEQAIGVIFGANIGTTVTAWIVSLFGFSFSIAAMAIPLFGFGYILKYFKKFKIHNFAESFKNPKNANDENDHVKFLENYIDEMNSAITDFLQKCARLPNANRDDRQHFSTLLHITDTLENLSDETCSLMHTVKKYESTSRRSKEIEDYVERVGLNKLIIILSKLRK